MSLRCLLLLLLVAPAWAQLPQTCSVQNEAAFSPSGRYLAVPAGTDKKPGFRCWDLSTRSPVRFVPLALTFPLSVDVSNDGTLAIASGNSQGTVAVEIWGQERKWSHQGPGDMLAFQVRWSPDGRQLSTFPWGRIRQGTTLKVWSGQGVTELNTWFLGWSGNNQLYCQEQDTLAVRAPGEKSPLHSLKLEGRNLSYSAPDRDGNLRCPGPAEDQEEIYSPELKLLRTQPAQAFRLGQTDFKIRTTGRMGEGKATLSTGSGKALGTWPALYAQAVSHDESTMALVVPDQVLLVDLNASARQQKLVLAPEPEPEQAKRWVVVTEVLNGRTGPSLTASVSRRFKQGEQLTASGPPVKDAQGAWWLPVGKSLFVRLQPVYVRALRD
jgi:hypothetical protein